MLQESLPKSGLPYRTKKQRYGEDVENSGNQTPALKHLMKVGVELNIRKDPGCDVRTRMWTVVPTAYSPPARTSMLCVMWRENLTTWLTNSTKIIRIEVPRTSSGRS